MTAANIEHLLEPLEKEPGGISPKVRIALKPKRTAPSGMVCTLVLPVALNSV